MPDDCLGECIVFADSDYKTVGPECYPILLKPGIQCEVPIHGNMCRLQITMSQTLTDLLIKGKRCVICVFRYSDGKIDPFFMNIRELNQAVASELMMMIDGASSGRHLLAIYDSETNVPMYQLDFVIPPSALLGGAMWASDEVRLQATELRLTVSDEDRWRGFAGFVPLKQRQWWSELHLVREDGSTEVIDKREK